ncbi:GL24606 [Drosophila persimilis]|uniref:GL24606 n=1 Tax=Drosophila persimilis TaxID=7234 RepID=B4H5X1_DROPE|nr:GL24606 [Drosophila persimilis]
MCLSLRKLCQACRVDDDRYTPDRQPKPRDSSQKKGVPEGGKHQKLKYQFQALPEAFHNSPICPPPSHGGQQSRRYSIPSQVSRPPRFNTGGYGAFEDFGAACQAPPPASPSALMAYPTASKVPVSFNKLLYLDGRIWDNGSGREQGFNRSLLIERKGTRRGTQTRTVAFEEECDC